jgi:curved DNA-binding protein CbpA
MKDYYNILGVNPEASNDEIKRMYHKLSKKYHPDANITDPDLRKWSEDRMKELNEAYDILKDPTKRALYDRQRRVPSQPNPGPTPPPPPAGPSAMAQLQQSVVMRSAAISALSFGLVGLMRGGIPFAISGALIGAVFGAMLGNIRLAGLPPGVTAGIFIGMFLGAALLKLSLAGLLVGALLGGLAGWWLGR